MGKVLVVIFLALASNIGLCFAYDVADVLQFPLDGYYRNGNALGTFNFISNGKYHLGEDAGGRATTRVYAIGNGKVMKAKIHTGYGGMYVIEHTLPSGEKICSLYAHLNLETFAKAEGAEVKRGDYLGQIGTTAQNGGYSEHLHFGILKGAYPSNPDTYICNDWVLSGYTACADIVSNWYSPTELIANQVSIPYRRVGNVAWNPPNKSCFYAERWVYYQNGYPNGGQSLGSNSICQQKEYEMMMALGGAFSNWWNVVYSPSDLIENGICSQ